MLLIRPARVAPSLSNGTFCRVVAPLSNNQIRVLESQLPRTNFFVANMWTCYAEGPPSSGKLYVIHTLLASFRWANIGNYTSEDEAARGVLKQDPSDTHTTIQRQCSVLPQQFVDDDGVRTGFVRSKQKAIQLSLTSAACRRLSQARR